MLTKDEKFARLRLIRCKNVGPMTFWDLVRIHGSASVAISELPNLAKRGGGAGKIIASSSSIEKEIEETKKFGAQFIFEDSELYPPLLKAVDDRPPILIAKGKVDILKNVKKVAVVGSRNASTNGIIISAGLSEHLGAAGYIVISGLAKGIDAAAHNASISTGTVGVIAGGINHIYPYENTNLFKMMYEKGVVLSEQPFNSLPLPKHFPQRNRIISGISLGIVVVEAAIRSGTLITAKCALDQGREVFVVPGSPMDQRYRGSNHLIKSGAHLIEDAEDIINGLSDLSISTDYVSDYDKSLSNISQGAISFNDTELNKYRPILLNHLSYAPTSVESISLCAEIPAHILNYLIVELELAGKAERLFGNKVVLIGSN